MRAVSSYNMNEDQDLVLRVSSGDDRAREEFVHKFGRLIFKIASVVREQVGGFDHETGDIVGHVYVNLLEDDCRRLTSWKGLSKLSTYVAMLTRNIAIDYFKTRRKPVILSNRVEGQVVPQPFKDEAEAEKESLRKLRLTALTQSLDQLSAQQLAVINLRLAGNSLREIAVMVGIPEGTVFVQNSRALAKLRKSIVSAMNAAAD